MPPEESVEHTNQLGHGPDQQALQLLIVTLSKSLSALLPYFILFILLPNSCQLTDDQVIKLIVVNHLKARPLVLMVGPPGPVGGVNSVILEECGKLPDVLSPP